MNQVVKFERTRKQRLDWKQEAEVKESKKQDRRRRDERKTRGDEWETEDECV